MLFGSHHFSTNLLREARVTQEAMLASWSMAEITISEPSGKGRAKERLRKSCVVEEPRTMLEGEALMYFAAAE